MVNYYDNTLLFQGALFLFRFYIKYRFRQSFLVKDIPENLKQVPDCIAVTSNDKEETTAEGKETSTKKKGILEIVTQEQFDKTQAYGLAKTTFGLVSMVKDFAFKLIALKFQAKIWYFLREKVPFIKNRPEGSLVHCVSYAAVGEVIELLVDLPFDYYYHFHLEEKFGFNKQTKTTFAKDIAKTLLLKVGILHPLQTGVINFVVNRFGKDFPKYLFAATSSILFAASFVVPTFIMPLFYKFTPLEDGSSLKKKIDALAEKLNYPLTKIYEMDGSTKSSHSNAFMFGFWKNKRIVLFDTLIQQLNEDEIVAVLGHELGHWYHGHTMQMLLANLGMVASICYAARELIFDKKLYSDFGFGKTISHSDRKEIPSPVIGFELFSDLVWSPLGEVISVLMVLVSRRFEFQADEFACQHGYGKELYVGLIKINRENLGNLTPDWLYSMLRFSHPVLPERLDFIASEVLRGNSWAPPARAGLALTSP